MSLRIAEVPAVGDDPPAGLRLTGPHAKERFAALFDEHAPGLWRYLARQVGASQAEDVVAETFLAAWSGRGDYRPERGSARAWLFGIAVNLLRRHHRVQAQQQRMSQRLTTHVESVGGPEDGVAARVDARTHVAALAAAIAALPDGDRDVLLLSSLGELSTKEIATALGIPEGTVRSRLHRVRRDLRALKGDS
ncbi:DNA-directed RNA polymerase sigma-70 factor [Actinoplanes ianthinogenes]|uniref:DNA-directed RNA polymerase sigma-70 factor n=1 Tax=Actinoplanes ianthinogenes TaxID=122358 RepID=A0ABM7M9F1_9ACTN|nr:sigma-70 family RNA polymerase sigma factor [Actinoplanes ianthinogenes]BCJ48278.1 DNA-directed RNA polymerase sigma-70 factor [Actinoplanes ianthinogenes]GGR07640.1 DNA-directed RNA polymerase sigma-70 factor [Actinoplanes ianthinogenes]